MADDALRRELEAIAADKTLSLEERRAKAEDAARDYVARRIFADGDPLTRMMVLSLMNAALARTKKEPPK